MSDRVERTWGEFSLDELGPRTRLHVQDLESSADHPRWNEADMPHVVIRTIGRKSGKEHKVALCYMPDEDEVPVIVASFAGSPHNPAWFWNLSDSTANPEVHVRTQSEQYWSRPEIIVDGTEYDRLWARLMELRPWYGDYKPLTTRVFPIIRLPRTRPARDQG